MSIITCYKISPRSVAYEGKLKKGGGSQVSCSAVGLRTLSKKESNSGSSGFTGGSGSGMTSTIGVI
jgi:hypothetical protein